MIVPVGGAYLPLKIMKKDEAADWLILFLIILPLFMGTYLRNTMWGSGVALWKDCVSKSSQKDALRLNPRYSLSMYNLGLVFYKRGFMDKAIYYYKGAIENDSNFSDSFYNLGLAYYQKGLYKEAIEAYENVLEIKPDYENAYINLGLAYKGLKKWNRAIEAFHEELKHYPDSVSAHLYLGESYEAIRNYPMALVHYRKALNHPNSPDTVKIRQAVSSIEGGQERRKETRVDGKD
jgi:tetratricopeptide (TPR) repeat protein